MVSLIAVGGQASPRPVNGLVRSFYNEPEVGASVYLVKPINEWPLKDPAVLAETQTDGQGQFHFDAMPKVDPDSCGVFILGRDMTVGRASPSEGPHQLVVWMDKAERDRVLVLGPDDKPLPGETVFSGLRNDCPQEVMSRLSQVTDSNGVCTLPKLGEVEDPRYFESYLTWPGTRREDPPGFDQVIRLHKYNTVYGRVVDGQTKKPVAGSNVIIEPLVNGAPRSYQVSTDHEGNYRLGHLCEGSYRVSASGPMGEPHAEDLDHVHLDQGEDRQLPDVEYDAPGTLEVSTLWQDNHRPCPLVDIWLDRASIGFSAPDTSTDGRGTMELASGAYRLTAKGAQPINIVIHQGEVTKVKVFIPPPTNVTQAQLIDSAESVDYNTQFKSVEHVYGHVLDSSGKPVAHAEVVVVSYWMDRTLTDEKGQFAFGRSTLPFKIRASKDDLAAPTAILRDEGNSLKVQLRLAAKAFSISGRVVGIDGAPVPSPEVEVVDLDRLDDYLIRTGEGGAGGAFKIDGLWPDMKYLVKVYKPGVGAWRSPALMGANFHGGINLGTIKLPRTAGSAIPVSH